MPTKYYQGQMVLTAKDIAEAIHFRKDRGGFDKALRQVKHWTACGLLKTISPVETGRGVAREYVDEPTILIAAVLQELTLFGLTVDMMEPIAERLRDDFEEGDPDEIFAAAMTDEFKGYLNVEFDADAKGRLSLVDVRAFSTYWDSEPLEENMPNSGSSILLNLPKIIERVTWPVDEEFEAELEAIQKGRK